MKGVIRFRAVSTFSSAHFVRALVVLLAAFSVGNVRADVGSSTPPHYALGTSSGSYDISDLEQLSLYNGHLTFRLPVRDITTGRGRGALPISILISQMWSTGSFYVDTGYGGYYQSYPAPNWSSSVIAPRPGGVGIRQTGGSTTCGYPSNYRTAYTYSHTRMIYTEPDGTEHELRDLVYDGRTVNRPTPYCTSWRAPRGSVWVTHDGSGMTFISDAPIYDDFSETDDYDNPWMVTGWLFFKDGTRYRIVNNAAVTVYDRNGNATAYNNYTWDDHNTYHTFVDSLNRQTDLTLNWDGTIPDDTVSYRGFNNAQRTIRVWHATLDQVLRSDLTPRRAKTYIELFPEMGGAMDEGPYNPPLISALELPDGSVYRFYYNHYGELSRFEPPTGGAVEYDYTPGSGVVGDPTGYSGPMAVYRQLVERRVYPNGGTGNTYASRTTYSYASSGNGDNYGTTTTTVDTYDGGGTRVAREKHYFWGVPLTGPSMGSPYGRWLEGREFKVETLDPSGDGSYVLRRAEFTWRQRAPVYWWWGNAFSEPPNDPRMVETKITVEPTGPNLVTKRTAIDPNDPNHVGFDQVNNPTDLWEYDYGVGAPGDFIRRTHTDYVTDPAYFNADANPTVASHIRDLPLQQWVSSDVAGSDKASLTVYGYDQFGLADCPQIVGHDAAYSTGLVRRGNVTSVTRYANAAASAGAVTSSLQYDIAGNVVSATDPNGKTSYISYADNFSDGNNGRHTFAFSTSATTAVPDPSGQFASTTPLITTNAYDYWTGAATATTDPNGQTTTYDYTDALERLKVVSRPDQGSTSYSYGRAMNAGLMRDYVRTVTALDATRSVESYQFYDGLGRPSRTLLNEGGSPPVFLTSDTQYDAPGRVWRVSNPYRSNGSGDDVNPSGLWTTTGYDGLGRMTSVTTPDGATVTTSFNGNYVTVTDQASKKRRSKADALGRIVRVDEPDGAGTLGQFDAPVQPTSYTYDVLGNLRKVDQGGQQRFFMYDSLGRLIRVKNPEQGNVAADADFPALTAPAFGNPGGQWSTGYRYDANGNLTKRKDARNVVTAYGYDALNRNITTSYTNDPSGTPPAGRKYDFGVNGKGRPYSVGQSGTTTSAVYFDEYDAVGRPLVRRQKFETGGVWSADYTVTRAYDKAGNVLTQTYPSGRTVSYNYDAAGRPGDYNGQAAVAGNLGDGTQRTYASEVLYDELGGMSQERYGTDTPVYNKHLYNGRGQLAEIRVSTYGLSAPGHETDWNRGALINHYSDSGWGATGGGPDNNGNLKKQDIYIPADDAISGYSLGTFFYEYDALNRLKRVREGRNGVEQWAQQYDYDRWGNRTIDHVASYIVPQPQFTVDQSTNRLGVPAGQAGQMGYDPAGNLTLDTYQGGQGGGGTRTYDAENRMTSAQFVAGQTQTAAYAYDADGLRVRRLVGTSSEAWQVYGMGGELLAEYAPGAAPNSPRKEYGYRGGELLVTASASGASSAPGVSTQAVAWTNVVGASASGSTLTKTAATGWGNAGASSAQSITSGDGYVEFTASQAAVDRVCGLSRGDTDQNITDVDFGILLSDGGYAYAVEGGAVKANGGAYATGDRLRVAAEGGAVKYYKNGALFYTSAVAPTYPLLADASIYTAGASVSNAVISGSLTSAAAASWANAAGVTASGGSLTKTAATGWGNAGASSAQAVASGGVYVEFTATADRTDRACGLGRAETARSLPDIEFGILLSDGGYAYAVEGGAVRANGGAYATGDRLRVSVEGGAVRYYKNGALFYTSAAAPAYPLRAEAALYQQGAGLGGVIVWGAAAQATADVRWLVTDQLGTPRMVVDRTGSLAGVTRHDYLPFGEELLAGTGGRTATQGYSTDDHVRQKLVTNERDGETDLDFFEARYYAYAQGRFTSVDGGAFSATTPQGFNRYANCLNNPLRYVDPDGLYNRDVHYDLTRVLALAAGFSDNDAKAIAQANQRVDDNWRTSPLPGKKQKTGYLNRKRYHFTTPEQRERLLNNFRQSGSIDDLGIYLHAMQDSYSHRGFPAWSGQVDIMQTPSEWDDADDTWRDVNKANDMAEQTYLFLKNVAGPIMENRGAAEKRGFTVPWGLLLGSIDQFNAARTEEEKRYILMVLESRIRLYIKEQQIRNGNGEPNRTRKRRRGRD